MTTLPHVREPDKPSQAFPVPRMRAASARTDVGGVGLRYAERRGERGDCDRGQPRQNLLVKYVLAWPCRFRRPAPLPFCRFVFLLGNPVEGERDSGGKLNAIPL